MFMAVGFIATACVIGAIASELSAPQQDFALASPSGLKGKTVCTYTHYVQKVTRFRATNLPEAGHSSMDECIKLLKAKTVDAVVYDAPILHAIAQSDPALSSYSVGDSFDEFDLGPAGSPSAEAAVVLSQIQWALGKLLHEPALLKEVRRPWFGLNKNLNMDDEGEPVADGMWWLCACCWTLFFGLQLLSANTPWATYLRRKIPPLNGWTEWVFGSQEERDDHKKFKSSDDSLFDCLPQACKPHLAAATTATVAPEGGTQAELKVEGNAGGIVITGDAITITGENLTATRTDSGSVRSESPVFKMDGENEGRGKVRLEPIDAEN
jgi:hypothetical protein